MSKDLIALFLIFKELKNNIEFSTLAFFYSIQKKIKVYFYWSKVTASFKITVIPSSSIQKKV